MPNCTTLPVWLAGQQARAAVHRALVQFTQHADINEAAVVCLDGDRHVVIMCEELAILVGHRVRIDGDKVAQRRQRGKERRGDGRNGQHERRGTE